MSTANMVPATPPQTIAADRPMTFGRLVVAYLKESKYESVRLLRVPSFVIPFTALPVIFYLFFGVLLAGAGANDPAHAKNLFVNWGVFGVMGPGLFGFGMVLAMERSEGLVTLKRALPMPTAAYLLGKMAMAALFSSIVMVTLVIAALLAGHIALTGLQLLTVSAINVMGASVFCAIGLFVGVLASGKSAPAITNLIYMPMMFFGGLFFPLPKKVHFLVYFSPAYYLDQLSLHAAGLPSTGQIVNNIAVLVVVTIVLVFLAVRRLAIKG